MVGASEDCDANQRERPGPLVGGRTGRRKRSWVMVGSHEGAPHLQHLSPYFRVTAYPDRETGRRESDFCPRGPLGFAAVRGNGCGVATKREIQVAASWPGTAACGRRNGHAAAHADQRSRSSAWKNKLSETPGRLSNAGVWSSPGTNTLQRVRTLPSWSHGVISAGPGPQESSPRRRAWMPFGAFTRIQEVRV